MGTAMQSQNLKVTTYNSFFGQCKSKIKPWGGSQDHSTLFMQNPHGCGHCTIRPRGDLNRVNLPFFPISNQLNFQPVKPAKISKLTTHSSPSEHGNDTNQSH